MLKKFIFLAQSVGLPIPKLFESILVSKTFPERKGTFPD
jgi:hypothetical protein